jgi:hypothetical protein
MKNYQKEANDLGVPLIPAIDKKFHDSSPVIAICGECGMHIYHVMGYVCNNTRCPTSLSRVHKTSGGTALP